ncbi:uncharacterized protein LOC141530759 [Cotesia typhae]|uniref:uncharacterized protein LOC141530759 n=1 Tax=Cotesia typhae TaxID=2053667 RepID=UPI003D683B7C
MLGSEKRSLKDKSFNFHPELVSCWKEILSSGMNKEDKSKMDNKYPNKGNCPLVAPILNPEMLPLLNKTSKSRDKYLANHQDLCGKSLVALGTAICQIFNDKEEPLDKQDLLQLLCDSSSMMCELMFQLTKSRRAQLYPCVDEKRKSILEDSPTDQFLFGENFAKKIKSAVVIEKTGLSIKNQNFKKEFSKSKTYLNWKSPSAPRSNQTGYNRSSFMRKSNAFKNNHSTIRSRSENQPPLALQNQTQNKK